jgi:anti-sigma B factor antagonist
MNPMSIQSSPLLEVRREPRAGLLRLDVSGELDASTAPILRDALVNAIDGQGGVIVVDLSKVGFIDSEGLGTLVGGLKRAIEHGTQLRFVVTHPQVRKVLDITGLGRVLDIYDTVETALSGRQLTGRQPERRPGGATEPSVRPSRTLD